MSNGVFNFYFLALLHSEILGWPKFTLGGPSPLGRPLAILMVVTNFYMRPEYLTIAISNLI